MRNIEKALIRLEVFLFLNSEKTSVMHWREGRGAKFIPFQQEVYSTCICSHCFLSLIHVRHGPCLVNSLIICCNQIVFCNTDNIQVTLKFDC
jgi:hypothetical protein